MKIGERLQLSVALLMLLLTLAGGIIAFCAFLWPAVFVKTIPFHELRPVHVSAALFWILTSASGVIIAFHKDDGFFNNNNEFLLKLFRFSWYISIVLVFYAYANRLYGGREYWEFPPIISLPLMISWILLLAALVPRRFFQLSKEPLYRVMWATGMLFFLLCLIEQNLYLIPTLRGSIIKEMTIQWKSNGSIVGAWNQMIYGASLYLMVKVTGKKELATTKKAYAFYFLGLTNLMFNWGHHIYNLPAHGFIRNISYVISMTEWLFLISILRDFSNIIRQHDNNRTWLGIRFITVAEYWVGLNLLLALLMSIPAINRYTHGTHITVAHAMGTTIGINTMILLGCIGYLIEKETLVPLNSKRVNIAWLFIQGGLFVFWIDLIASGVYKAILESQPQPAYRAVIDPVSRLLEPGLWAGAMLSVGLGYVVVLYLRKLINADVR